MWYSMSILKREKKNTNRYSSIRCSLIRYASIGRKVMEWKKKDIW